MTQQPSGRSDTTEAWLTHRGVDRNPDAHNPTEPDEEAVLRQLYGPPDDDGVFRRRWEVGDGQGDRDVNLAIASGQAGNPLLVAHRPGSEQRAEQVAELRPQAYLGPRSVHGPAVRAAGALPGAARDRDRAPLVPSGALPPHPS